nr:DMT family transporter [Planococcus glaciei]
MLTAVLVSLILRSYPSKLQWIGVVIGLAGVSATVLVGGGETAGMNIGDVFVFLSILVQVLSYIVISKAAGSMDPRLLTAYMFIIGAGVLFIISLIQEPGEIAAFADVPSTFWVAFFFSAVLGTAVGHLLYNYSIGQAGATKAAIFMNLNTFFLTCRSGCHFGRSDHDQSPVRFGADYRRRPVWIGCSRRLVEKT